MDVFYEILKYTIPALTVLITTWFLVRSFLKSSEKQRYMEHIMKNNEITLPLRFQAYERITLFLERISIESLLMRLNQPGMNSRQLHSELLTSIRNEYEHNLSQQVYMSVKSWEMVKNARAQMIKIINSAAEKTDPSLPALELNKKILENISDYSKSPTQVAIDFLKEEIRGLF
jgi:hypothetical protein